MALEQSSSGIVTTDLNGDIDYINRKFEKMTGYSRDEIAGKNINFLDSITQEKEFYDNILNMMEVKKEFVGEMSTMNSKGELVWVKVSLSPIKELDITTIGFLAVIDDITENRNLINDLNKKNRELEDAFKLLKDTQVQLMNDNKMASIGQLSAGIAHEINNPLGFVLSNFCTLKKYVSKCANSIQGYRKFKENINSKYEEVLTNEIKDIEKIEDKNDIDYILDDINELFDETEEGLERIRNIVMSLRNFAHENIDGAFQQYDLNQGVKDTLNIARNEVKYNSEVKLKLGEIPMISAIGSEINQVILNMLVNSSQAIKEKMEKNNISNEKSGDIFISTYCEDNKVCLLIQDNGIGIQKELLNRVFDPFFTTKPVGKGTGLGLSISYEIIKNKHKGDIEIESIINSGTKIIIKIPR